MKKDKALGLKFVWNTRCKFRDKGAKLWEEGDKLWIAGDKLWTEAILEVHGNIKMDWKNYSEEKKSYECHLETGEIFKP